MKSKIINLVLLTAFLMLSVVSASDFSLSLSNDFSRSKDTSVLTITNTNLTESITVNIANIAIKDTDNNILTINKDISNPIVIANGSSKDVTLSYSSLSSNLALGKFSTNINVTQVGSSDTAPTTIALGFLNTYCEYGYQEDDEDDRKLEIISLKDSSSDTDWKWKPLDKVEVDVKVKFTSDDNDDSIDGIIKLELYDTEENQFIEFENDDDAEIEFSLDEGDSVTETIILEIPLEDLEKSTTRYKLYVKAYEDGEEETVCVDDVGGDYYQDIKIEKESYSVILNSLDLSSDVYPCSSDAEVTVTAYNVGSNDEDKVIVTLYNKELGINLQSNAFSLDEGDSKKVSFSFTLPKNAKEKTYPLVLKTQYRYSKSSSSYREESDDYTLNLKIEGECKAETPGVQITGELDPSTPEAIAGKQVIIKSKIINTGNIAATYTISLTGNSAWSSLAAIDPQTFTLNAGESKDVSIYLDIDKDAAGEKEFSIKASYANTSTEQLVALSVQEGLSQSRIIDHLSANWFIYLIILVNLILIIAIISVIRRITRKPSM